MTMKHKAKSTCAEVTPNASPGCIWGNLLVVSLNILYII